MVLFKIKNKEGKYSTGGLRPKFSKDGKIWDEKNLKKHLAQFRIARSVYGYAFPYKECTVEHFNVMKFASVDVEKWRRFQEGDTVVHFTG